MASLAPLNEAASFRNTTPFSPLTHTHCCTISSSTLTRTLTMAGLVGYASSDEESEVEQQSPPQVNAPIAFHTKAPS